MLSKCAALQPPDCTHLVFKDDFNAYQQQLHKKDNQKNPEELKKKKKKRRISPAPSKAVPATSQL